MLDGPGSGRPPDRPQGLPSKEMQQRGVEKQTVKRAMQEQLDNCRDLGIDLDRFIPSLRQRRAVPREAPRRPLKEAKGARNIDRLPPRPPRLVRQQAFMRDRVEDQMPARVRSDSDDEFEAVLAEESRQAREVIEQALRESGLVKEAPPLGRLRSDSDLEFEAVPPLEAERAKGPDGVSRSLGEILNNPRDFGDFLRHCEGEFSDENPLFWKAVEDWKNMPEGNFFRRWQKKRAARRIVNHFVRPASPKEVNLAADNRRGVLEARNLAELSRGLRAAQQEIFHVMESDTLKRFQKPG